jgi:hypothetical protein
MVVDCHPSASAEATPSAGSGGLGGALLQLPSSRPRGSGLPECLALSPAAIGKGTTHVVASV